MAGNGSPCVWLVHSCIHTALPRAVTDERPASARCIAPDAVRPHAASVVQPREIHVQTWNCFGTAMNVRSMLRWRGTPDAHRFVHPAVRAALRQADLLCMQEVWLSDAVELFDGLDHDHKLRDGIEGNWRTLTVSGSGLGVASRFPVTRRAIRPFETRGIGIDRFARKGMVHARVRFDDTAERALDVITTHLQSGMGRRPRRVRERQLQEVRKAVDELGGADRGVLLCGDLNIDGMRGVRRGEYATLTSLFPDFEDLGASADAPTMCPHPLHNTLAHRYWSKEPMQRLDYLLLRAPAGGWLVADGCRRLLDQPLPPDGGSATFASDHFGLRAKLRLSGQAPPHPQTTEHSPA
jgi:endonuclease/exonuclease/phosphatase family metal-dependent hydrolase